MRYLLFLFFTFTSVFADEGAIQSQIQSQSSNYFEEFVNMMLTLLFLLGFAIVTLFIVKKIMRSKMRQRGGGEKAIKIIEKQPLHAKASLYLVDILGKSVVIGESAAGIHLITEIPQEAASAEDIIELEKEPQPFSSTPSFKEILQNKLKLFFFKQKKL